MVVANRDQIFSEAHLATGRDRKLSLRSAARAARLSLGLESTKKGLSRSWGYPEHRRAAGTTPRPPFGCTGWRGGGRGASKARAAALPRLTRIFLGEVRVVVQFPLYILLCHAAPPAERAENSCQSPAVSLQGLYS